MELDLYGRNVYVAYHPLRAIEWSLGVEAAIDEIITPAKLMEQEILTLAQQTLVGIDQNILAIVLAVVFVIVVAAAELSIESATDEVGAFIVTAREGREIYITGRLEYDPLTLDKECRRDVA